MKMLIFFFFVLMTPSLFAQERMNPIIANYGGVFEIPLADEKPDPNLQYTIVIEIVSGSENPKQINDALNNVARLLNLHAVGGVPKENLHVVLAIHGGATYALLNHKEYQAKYGTDNPNIKLLQALHDSGVVDLFLCGQSMKARGVDTNEIPSHVKVATSMLTTITTHQLKGYAMLKF